MMEQLDHYQIERISSNNAIIWNYNPPSAPHVGGQFEGMIKSTKRAIAAGLIDADANDEELQTVFVGVNSLRNSRPLTTGS